MQRIRGSTRTAGTCLLVYSYTVSPSVRPSGSHHPHRDTVVHPCIFIVPPSTSYSSRAAAGQGYSLVTAAGGRAEKGGKGEKSERVREYVTTHAIGLLHAHGPWPARLLPACLWSHHLDGAGRIHKIEAHARARRPLAPANLRLLLLLDDGSASISIWPRQSSTPLFELASGSNSRLGRKFV